METMKPEEPVDAKRHKRSAEATMELIHIKEKKKKRRDHSVAMATDIVGEDSAVLLETPHKKKKKKKRELENVTSETDINWEESEVAMETEHKRKKKKKEEHVTIETYNREHSVFALEKEHKKKRKKEEEENVTIQTEINGEESEVAQETEHKKKKKKKKETEEENVTIETYNRGEDSEVALETEHKKKKKKKKKKKREQEHVTIATDINREESEVAVETEPKKKEEEENVTIETYNRGEDLEVAVETDHKKKKRKKRDQEHVTIATDINVEESEVVVETEHKKNNKKKKNKREQEHVTIATDIHGEESEVSMETEHKKKEDEIVSIKTYNRGEDSEVTMETEHKKKKKKKKKQDVTSGADIIGESEVAVQTEHKEEENATIATDISDGVAVTMKTERNQGRGVSVSMAAASSCRTRSKRPAEETNDWVDPALLQELEEFVPNVRGRSVAAIRKLLRYDLERFRRFKQQGVAVRWGRGSEEEDQMIMRNLQDFMALTGISSPTELIYPDRYMDKCNQIKSLKAQHGFLEKIAEGIPRPCSQVYLKARRMIDPLNHQGRFSEYEVKSLIKLQTQHGNDWKLISEKMGRSIFSLQKRFNNLASGHGPWTPEETDRLKKAVRTHLEGLQSPAGSGLTREQLSKGLPWNQISQEVQTRSWVQCRVKWLRILQNRLAVHTEMFGRGAECVRTKILLIKVLFEKCPISTADVRWDEVAQAMGKMTLLSAQRMFHRLKSSRVPGWRKMSKKEIIQFLHREVLPALEARLEDLKDGLETPQNPENPENQPEETYQLDRIFAEDRQ